MSPPNAERPTVTFAADDIEDLINTLPTLFGFRPAESVVAIATYGPTHRFGFRMRADLPTLDGIDLAARTVQHHLLRQGAQGAVVLVLTEKQGLARDLTEAITAVLGPIQPIVVARANAQSYWVEVPGFPEEGISYQVSDHHVAVVTAIAAGQQIFADRAAVERLYAPVTGARRKAMIAACERAAAQLSLSAHATLPGAAASLNAVIRHIESGRPLSDDLAAQLCVWLSDSQVFRYVWEAITVESVAAWRDAMTQLSQAVVPGYEAPVLALAAFAAWASGDGTRALIAVTRADQVTTDVPASDHEMVRLMKAIVEQGVPPEFWRRAPR